MRIRVSFAAILAIPLMNLFATPGTGCQLRYADSRPISRVFPYYGLTTADRRALDCLFEPLVRETQLATYRSEIVDETRIEQGTDGTRWFIPLLTTTWHSGNPVTTDDVVRTFKELARLRGLHLEDWYQELIYLDLIKNVSADGNRIVIDYTVPMTRDKVMASLSNVYVIPWRDLPRLTTIYGGRINEYAPAADELGKKLVGNGRWQAPASGPMINDNHEISLIAFNGYPSGRSSITDIYSDFQALPSERVRRFTSGPVNLLLDLPPALASQAKAVNGAQTLNRPQNTFTDVVISNRNPVFQDRRVREALIYAINRQKILESVYAKDEGDLLEGPFPPNTICYNTDVVIRPYSKERAVALLRDAGFRGDEKSGWKKGSLSLDGLEFMLENALGEEANDAGRIATTIRDNLKEIGVFVTILSKDPAQVQKDLQDGAYDFYYESWTLGEAYNVRRVLSCNVEEHPENRHLFCAPEVEALLTEYDKIQTNDVKRSEVGKRLHAAIAQSCDRIYLISPRQTAIFKSKEIEFRSAGTFLFGAPGTWDCPAPQPHE